MTSPSVSVLYGTCHCGCGGTTTIAKFSWPLRGHVKGEPKRFIKGHEKIQRPIIEDAIPFKIDGVYCRLIPLTRGMWTIVWESDYAYLMQWKWFAVWDRRGNTFYVCRAEKADTPSGQRVVRMHRLLLNLDSQDKRKGDHANHIGLDNRRSNLRPATNRQNVCNSGRNSRNTTGHKGVTLRARGVYRVRVNNAEGKRIHVGDFHDLEAAARAAIAARDKYHGEFACHE